MKKIILHLLIITTIISCNNQIKKDNFKESKDAKVNMIKKITPIKSIDFFIGKWELTEKKMDNKVINLNCKNKSTWEFIKKGNLVLQKKTTLHTDCKSKSSNRFGKVNFKSPNGLYYFIDDTGFYVTVNKEDKNTIIVTEKEFISGKIVNILYYYKRIE